MKKVYLLTVMIFLMACLPVPKIFSKFLKNDDVAQPTVQDDDKFLDIPQDDGLTRPIAQEEDVYVDPELEYAQIILDAMYGCFFNYVKDMDEDGNYVNRSGTLIRFAEEKPLKRSDNLSAADKANGILWQGETWINVIYFQEEKGEWKEHKFLRQNYRYYNDGTITSEWGSWLGFEHEEFGTNGCPAHFNQADAMILYN